MDELVNIPALLLFSDGGTRFQSSSVSMVCTLVASRNDLGKSGSTVSRGRLKTKPLVESTRVAEPSRKTSRAKVIVSVPQTDTGR